MFIGDKKITSKVAVTQAGTGGSGSVPEHSNSRMS